MKQYIQIINAVVIVLLLAACGGDESSVAAPKVVEKPERPLNYHVLVIGIEDYQNSGWPSLKTAKADAETMGQVLQEQYGFEVTTLIDSDASLGRILRQFDLYMDLTDQDALLVYFAGHGYYDKKMDEGYWIPYGAKRERLNLPAKEDWLETTSISKYINAIPARHVLVIADTCYGGSLFRGEKTSEKEVHWYKRAINAPSRYLITSGNLEPVLDSGINHSVFAQEVLNFLQYSEMDVFAASDIGHAIRNKVSQLTGQLVRMGPLLSPTDAGGEFIFVRNDAELRATELEEPLSNGEAHITRAATDYPAQTLARRIETYAEALQDKFVRPRILACLGPTGRTAQETELIRSRLYNHMTQIGGYILVERDAFEPILKEIELGTSAQADRRASTEIGKLLPASLILFGQVIESGHGLEIHIRIVESETSRVLVSTYETCASIDQLDDACQTLAQRITKDINRMRPMLIPVQTLENGTLSAGWGRFHGARKGDIFEIITKTGTGTVSEREVPLGTAELLLLNEESSEFNADWINAPAEANAILWLRRVF